MKRGTQARRAPPLAPLLRRMRRSLSKERGVRFAYVYGSVLRRRDPRDIDVAVYLNRSDFWDRAQEIAVRLEKAIGYDRPVDVHALNRACASYAFEVLANGRLLLDRDRRERLDWEAHALSRYQDLKPMLDFHDRRFLSR